MPTCPGGSVAWSSRGWSRTARGRDRPGPAHARSTPGTRKKIHAQAQPWNAKPQMKKAMSAAGPLAATIRALVGSVSAIHPPCHRRGPQWVHQLADRRELSREGEPVVPEVVGGELVEAVPVVGADPAEVPVARVASAGSPWRQVQSQGASASWPPSPPAWSSVMRGRSSSTRAGDSLDRSPIARVARIRAKARSYDPGVKSQMTHRP